MNEYSPGLHKLLHHLDHLKAMKAGKVVAPIHVSVWPTVRCNFKCEYCCCRNVDKSGRTDLDYEAFKQAVLVLALNGTKAIEFSGGGEPLLWPHFPDAVKYCTNLGLKCSLITNGTYLDTIPRETLLALSWLRISYQSARHAESINCAHLQGIKVSGSYIVTRPEDLDELSLFHQTAPLRVAVSRPCSEDFASEVEKKVTEIGKPLFYSDKETGKPEGCYMAWVRAAIDWRGNFLPCPAIQMSPENIGTIPADFVLCHIDQISEWLNDNRVHDLGHKCSYCNCGKEINDFYHKFRGEIEDPDFV